jgi:hypothetical protein
MDNAKASFYFNPIDSVKNFPTMSASNVVAPSNNTTDDEPPKGCCTVPQLKLTDDERFQKNCYSIRPKPGDMHSSLAYTLDGSKLVPPSSTKVPPQAISTMGQPDIDAVVKAGTKDFMKRQGGWYSDKSNPDSSEAREARLRKVFDAAYSSSDGGDRAGLTPEIQEICLPNDKVVCLLNCVEVIGMPESQVPNSEGFIQAAIIERGGDPKTRRLAIIASAGNASIKATETMYQMFQKNCCGLCTTTEQGFKNFEYGVNVLESHELSVINISNAVVHASVSKKKTKSYKASSGGAATLRCGDCCDCCCKCCKCILACNCCTCTCCDSCAGQRYVRYCASLTDFIFVLWSNPDLNASFKLSLSRQFGFTHAVKDDSVKV